MKLEFVIETEAVQLLKRTLVWRYHDETSEYSDDATGECESTSICPVAKKEIQFVFSDLFFAQSGQDNDLVFVITNLSTQPIWRIDLLLYPAPVAFYDDDKFNHERESIDMDWLHLGAEESKTLYANYARVDYGDQFMGWARYEDIDEPESDESSGQSSMSSSSVVPAEYCYSNRDSYDTVGFVVQP
jgi:hypothetical protein